MKPLHWRWKKTNYSFLIFDHVATPMKLRNIPLTDAPHEKKFRKNVDSIMWMTIKKGKATPRNISTKPMPRRRRGWFMMADITNKPQNDSARVQSRAEIFRHTIPQWLSHNADGNGSLWAGLPNWAAHRVVSL